MFLDQASSVTELLIAAVYTGTWPKVFEEGRSFQSGDLLKCKWIESLSKKTWWPPTGNSYMSPWLSIAHPENETKAVFARANEILERDIWASHFLTAPS